MSTIKTTHLQHPSAASPNLTLAADGSVSGGAGLGGLVHVHTETFSSQSSVSINNVFTSDYDRYRIMVEVPYHTNSANTTVWFRLRSSGVDENSANYNVGYHYTLMNSTVASGDLNHVSSTYGYVFSAVGSVGGIGAHSSMDFVNVAKSGAYKYAYGQYVSMQASTAVYGYSMFNQVSVLSAYDGMTLGINAGTMNGSVHIYGYANS